jgi:glutamate/tyrosine decarboxylase-like PLP-dependent enzyme
LFSTSCPCPCPLLTERPASVFIPVTAALLLTAQRDVAEKAFATTAGSYIPTDGEADAWQRGIPTTRRSSGLAVWMALRAHGWRTIRAAVKSNIELTRLLEVLLAERGFRILEGGELSVACARWEPRDQTREAIDRLQNTIARDVVSSGKAWFSTTRHAGRIWLRFNMVNLYLPRMPRGKSDKNDTALILGCVIAHELGHLLLGTHGHSIAGIMQAHWGIEQTQLALMSQLSFLPEEARLMRADTVAPEEKNNSSSALTSH